MGGWNKLVDGVNKTLDAVIGPLNVSAGYVDRIAKGDIPPKITDNYNGDFNTIKNNLNQCVDAVNALVADAATLAKAAVEGKLATRADASRHQGDFRKIVQGVNETLDAVIGPDQRSAAGHGGHGAGRPHRPHHQRVPGRPAEALQRREQHRRQAGPDRGRHRQQRQHPGQLQRGADLGLHRHGRRARSR